MAKQAAAMVAGDIVIALICKNGLHLSIGVCLTADVLADVAIIGYSNLPHEEIKQNEDGSKIVVKEKHSKFNPWEFMMGVGLMAITLVWI